MIEKIETFKDCFKMQIILITIYINKYLLKKSTMINRHFLPWIVVILSILPLLSCGQIIQLEIAEISTITLKPGSELTYSIKVPSDISQNQDLYIHIKPTVPDPLQVPHLTITSDQDYEQNCYNAHSEFAGICKIVSSQLTKGREFTLSIKCVTDCTLEMETYLSDIVTISVGDQLKLTAYGAEGLTEVIMVQIPNDTTYSILYVLASINNIEQHLNTVDQKLEMLVNYGDENVQTPTDEKFMAEGYPVPTGGRGAYLSSDEVKPGSWIKVYLRLQIGISITFHVRQLNDGNQTITLGSSYSDYTLGEQKRYFLSISNMVEELKDKTIELMFQLYSGDAVFEVGFSPEFKDIIPFIQQSSTVSYSLLPSLRKAYNFTGYIFIKVTATVTSEYVFYTKVKRDDATYIRPYQTYFGQLQLNQVQNFIMVERFAYEQGSQNTTMEYTFNINILSGQGNFFFSRCESIEKREGSKQNLSSCLVQNADGVEDPKFLKNQLQNQFIINEDKFTIRMAHDIKDCSVLEKKDNIIYKQCGFQIVAVGYLEQPFDFWISAERRFYSTYLKENVVTNDYISKQSYVYYAFSLPSLQNVEEIDIFVTTFSGESALIVSSSEPFPTLESTSHDLQIQTGEKSSITLSGETLAKQLHISLYAFQFTEVNLAVVVRRSTNSTQVDGSLLSMNSIILTKGVALTYTMQASSQTIRFKLFSLQDESIVVSLTQILGYNSFKVFDSSYNPLTCIGKIDNPSICEVATVKNTEYGIQVYGQLQVINKFTISYKGNILDCTTLPLNIQSKVVLHPLEIECFNFRVHRNVGLEFVTSFNHFQLINKQIGIKIYINNVELQSITGNHGTINAKDLAKSCPLNQKKTGFLKTCLVSIKYTTTSQSTQSFDFILEESDAQIALFQGVVQRVHDFDVSFGGGKLFYYFLYNTLPIKVFFTTHSPNYNYMLIAKIVNRQEFTKRARDGGDSLWSDYQNQKDIATENISLYVAELKNQQTSFVVIGQDFIDKFCTLTDGCFVLITVAATESPKNLKKQQTLSYELQVSQQDSRLPLGQTKVGFIEKGGLNTFLIDPEDAIVHISNLQSEGSLSGICVSIFGMTSEGVVVPFQNDVGGNFQVLKIVQINRIVVSLNVDIDHCSYMISYTSVQQPAKTVRLSTPYQLSLQTDDTQAFLFYNPHPTSFRILTLLSGGQADIYIKPFDSDNLTVKAVSEMDFTEFPMVDKMEGDFIVSSQNEYFCSDCAYYIVVTTKTKFIGEVVFLRIADPIPLTVRHFFSQKMSPQSEFSKENYIFYSLNSFNIEFNMMYGQIEVSISNPLKKQVVHSKISATTKFNIKAIDYETKEKIEYFSSKAMYMIRVKALSESAFIVKIDQSGATERIFEGFPTTLSFSENLKTTIEFVNSQQLEKPLTLMADILQSQGKDITLTLQIVTYLNTGEEVNQTTLLRSLVKSDNTYICSLNNIVGTYFITAQTNIPVNVTFLLFKNALTHISPSSNHFFDNQGIFELPSNNKNVMVQIFNCQGDLQAIASSNYQDIIDPSSANSSLITLKRPNYGGHYVFGVQNMHEQSSYFLKINNKYQGNALQYLINYYYYDFDGKNPYDSIDALNYDISSVMTEDKLIVSVMPPEITDNTQNTIIVKNISYWVYASNSRQDLNRGSRCSIRGNVVSSFSNDNSFISIDKSLLSQLVDQSDTGTLYVNVQASIQVEIISTSLNHKNYPQVLTIFYDTIQVQPNSEILVSYQYWFTNSLWVFLAWMLLPFILAGIAVYYVVKICFRVMVMRQKHMVDQIQVGAASVDASVEENKGAPLDSGQNLKSVDI